MSAEISPLMVRSPAAARPLWLRLRRSQPFTLTVIMCCLALLWVSPFIWMLATSFSATTFGEDMASLLPRLPLTLDNFRDAWDSADWLSLYATPLSLPSALSSCSYLPSPPPATSSPATNFAARKCYFCCFSSS